MKTYLVIESENTFGKVAYIETITENDNLLKYMNNKKVKSISTYTTKKVAQQQVDFLNKLYKEQ